jgi:hypothetical protein
MEASVTDHLKPWQRRIISVLPDDAEITFAPDGGAWVASWSLWGQGWSWRHGWATSWSEIAGPSVLPMVSGRIVVRAGPSFDAEIEKGIEILQVLGAIEAPDTQRPSPPVTPAPEPPATMKAYTARESAMWAFLSTDGGPLVAELMPEVHRRADAFRGRGLSECLTKAIQSVTDDVVAGRLP